MKKPATKFNYIPEAVQFNLPVSPGHPYYTDFSKLRGNFEENVVYKHLNFNVRKNIFDFETSSYMKRFIFFAGMRGSGKTTELLKYNKKLNTPQGFFTIFCSIDEELDINDLEYMDIVIFQLEKLLERIKKEKLKIKESIIKSMNKWFEERVKEINKRISSKAGIELDIETKFKTPILNLFSLVSKLKASIVGTKENAEIIRTTFRYRFNDFAIKFNEFIETVNKTVRAKSIGNEVLFIVDGLEKTLTADIRRRIIMDETNRIKQIKAYTIFTLPIELINEHNILMQYGFEFITFPFIKLEDEKGRKIKSAYDKFKEFIYRRVDKNLFENEKVTETIIKYSGGSPREALRIIYYGWLHSSDKAEKLTLKAVNKGLDKLADEIALFLTAEEIEKLKEIKKLNEQNKPVLYDGIVQDLLEKMIIMEYDDGTLKKVNPVLTRSRTYKTYIG